jgi:hypothetical protein
MAAFWNIALKQTNISEVRAVSTIREKSYSA